MKKLVDVSNNNGKVNWEKVKRDGYAGAFVKVTEGPSFVDSWYVDNLTACRTLGLRVGGYHFGHPNNSPVVEAKNFLSHLRFRPGDLLPVLDIETTDGCSSAAVEMWARAWLQHVAAQLGVKPIIYSGDSFARTNLGTLIHDYPVWVASYGAKPHIRWAAWQWTDKGGEGLDESVTPNLAALIYKPPAHLKVVKKLKHPLGPMLRAGTAYRLLNPLPSRKAKAV